MWSSEDDTSTIEALVFLGANVNLKNKVRRWPWGSLGNCMRY